MGRAGQAASDSLPIGQKPLGVGRWEGLRGAGGAAGSGAAGAGSGAAAGVGG